MVRTQHLAAGSLLLLWSVVSAAEDAYIPELGVRIRDVPAELRKPITTSELPRGFSAAMRIGKVYFDIYRRDELVPEGRGVGDPSYQASLLAEFEKLGTPGLKTQQTKIDGQEAWGVLGSGLVGPKKSIPYYYCHAYLVVDRHLVRFAIDALAWPDKPAEFDTALKMLSRVTFHPLSRSAAAENKPSSIAEEMPHRFVAGSRADLYSWTAIRREEQGIVDIEFNIDADGHIQNLTQTYTEHRSLGQEIATFMKEGIFRLPPDWAESGLQDRRFPMEFQFWLGELTDACPKQRDPRVAGAVVLAVCGRRGQE